MTELKTCPFCEYAEFIEITNSRLLVGYTVEIACTLCDITMRKYWSDAESENEAIEKTIAYWNARGK